MKKEFKCTEEKTWMSKGHKWPYASQFLLSKVQKAHVGANTNLKYTGWLEEDWLLTATLKKGQSKVNKLRLIWQLDQFLASFAL